MVDLLRNIHREQEEITKKLEEDSQLSFYQSFFKNNSYTSISSLIGADKLDLAVAIIMTEHPELDTEYVKKAVTENKTFFEGLDRISLEKFTDVLYALQISGAYHLIRNRFAIGRPLEISDIFERDGITTILLQQLIRQFDATPETFVSFMDLFDKYNDTFGEALVTATIINELKKDRDDHYQEIADIAEEIREERGVKVKIPDRAKHKMVSRTMAENWNIDNILEPVKNARNYYEKKEQEQRAKRRYLTKLQDAYNLLEKDIYKAITNGEEIKNIDKLIGKIPEESIRKQVLSIVYSHNKTIYDKTSREYQHLSANTASRYQVLLAKYGISPEDYEVGTVMGNSIEELETMLKKLGSLNITLPRDILIVAQQSNLETINNYLSLSERGIITGELLLSHNALLNPSSKEYESFMRNLALIQEKKINPYYFTASESVLITPHKTFRQGLETLQDYRLDSLMKTDLDYSFIANQNLAQAIDTLLELGLEKTLETDISLLNYAEKFGRLKLLKSLNLPVESKEDVISVLTTDKFFVQDSEIDNYIYNAVPHNLPSRVTPLSEPKKKNPDVAKLAGYEETPRTYSFNGIVISKNKVARNLSMIATTGRTSDRLLYGVLKGSTLTDEETEKVVSALSNKKTTAVVKQKQ